MSFLDNLQGVKIGDPVKKTITYEDVNTGEELSAEVYVKQYGIADARRFAAAYSAKDNGDARLAESIASNILVEKSEEDKTLVPIGTAEEILTCSQSFILALLEAIGSVNSPKKQTLKSPMKKSSSAN